MCNSNNAKGQIVGNILNKTWFQKVVFAFWFYVCKSLVTTIRGTQESHSNLIIIYLKQITFFYILRFYHPFQLVIRKILFFAGLLVDLTKRPVAYPCQVPSFPPGNVHQTRFAPWRGPAERLAPPSL